MKTLGYLLKILADTPDFFPNITLAPSKQNPIRLCSKYLSLNTCFSYTDINVSKITSDVVSSNSTKSIKTVMTSSEFGNSDFKYIIKTLLCETVQASSIIIDILQFVSINLPKIYFLNFVGVNFVTFGTINLECNEIPIFALFSINLMSDESVNAK